MKLKGKLIKKDSVKTYGDNGFKKREIVIETDDQYPQKIQIEFHQDRVDLAKDLKKDDLIEVSINVNGREWTNPSGEVKYFNSIVGWRIEKIEAPTTAPQTSNFSTEDDPDDLPF